MSEFSESYHLYSSDQNDGVKLIKKSWLRGFVYPAVHNWVTITPSGRIFQPNKRLIHNNPGTLLHLINAEDHGWSISIYEGKQRTFHYECSWEEDIEINQDEYDRDRFVELVNRNPNKLKSVTPLDITKIFYVSDYEEIFESNPLHQVAELLRLEHYEWISYEYNQCEYKENPKEFLNREIKVVRSLLT